MGTSFGNRLVGSAVNGLSINQLDIANEKVEADLYTNVNTNRFGLSGCLRRDLHRGLVWYEMTFAAYRMNRRDADRADFRIHWVYGRYARLATTRISTIAPGLLSEATSTAVHAGKGSDTYSLLTSLNKSKWS